MIPMITGISGISSVFSSQVLEIEAKQDQRVKRTASILALSLHSRPECRDDRALTKETLQLFYRE